ncbi:MAG: ribosome maturation factor RimM [Rhodomicrobium sp.]
MTEDKVLLGRITAPHGLKGEVKIAAFTAAPRDIAAYGALTDADGAREFHITSMHSAKGGSVVARLRGVSDRDEAEKLRGVDLYAPRAALPPPEEDEFYYSDLIGLQAVSPGGEPIGEVIAVQNFGAGDLIEIRFVDERQPVLIPFDGAHVPHVDLEAGRVTIVRPVYEQGQGGEGS